MPNTVQVRRLNAGQIVGIYNQYMKYDFPADELKPLHIILQSVLTGKYFCFGLYKSTELLGYAFFLKSRQSTMLLLDYFAILQPFRSQGFGKRFFAVLTRLLESYGGILVEVEQVEKATTEAQQEERKARIRFYQQVGFHITGVGCSLFKVDYEILYMPLQQQLDRESACLQMAYLYQGLLPMKKFKKFVRFYAHSPMSENTVAE